MSKQSILLIDHETNVREVLQICLNKIGGWNVKSVASAKECFEALKLERPDAILLDVLMPETDGLLFTQLLKKNPSTQSIPIVFITAYAHWFSRQQLRELGVAAAIAKPFDPVRLPLDIAVVLGWSVANQKSSGRSTTITAAP